MLVMPGHLHGVQGLGLLIDEQRLVEMSLVSSGLAAGFQSNLLADACDARLLRPKGEYAPVLGRYPSIQGHGNDHVAELAARFAH
eukprot:2472544-Alexandrium_andersonii.AAC.1